MTPTCALDGFRDATLTTVVEGRTYHVCAKCEGAQRAKAAAANVRANRPPPRSIAAVARVKRMAADGPVTPGIVATALGLTVAGAGRFLRRLEERGEFVLVAARQGQRGGSVYALRPAPTQFTQSIRLEVQ